MRSLNSCVQFSKIRSWAAAGVLSKREFDPLWKFGLRTKNFWETWSQQLNSD